MEDAAMGLAKLNPIVRFFSTPGVYIIVHFILNALFGGLNAGGVLKNNIGGKIVNVIHAVISLLVMINLGLNPLIYGGPNELKGQPLFWLLIIHGVVNIIYGVLVCVIPEEEANKTIKIIYSCVSSLVLIAIAIFGSPKLRKKMKEAAKKMKDKAKEMKDKVSGTKAEGTATENPPEAPAETTEGTAATEEFGKRQRRRNPPKRRRKKKY